jgi:hypothetical protein
LQIEIEIKDTERERGTRRVKINYHETLKPFQNDEFLCRWLIKICVCVAEKDLMQKKEIQSIKISRENSIFMSSCAKSIDSAICSVMTFLDEKWKSE